MKFIIFVEGYTEKEIIPTFLKKWLDPRLIRPVGIKPVRFDGWKELVKDTRTKFDLYINSPEKDDIIAVIALLDLYGLDFFPSNKETAIDRYSWAKNHLESQVNHHPKFRQFFAVHEIEAWLLSNPDLFSGEIKKLIPSKPPEHINFNEPPASLLDRLYMSKIGRHYKKVVNGKELFSKLDPNIAVEKCPMLKELLTEMLVLAKDAGH